LKCTVDFGSCAAALRDEYLEINHGKIQMSFDIFLTSFQGGEVQPLPRVTVLRALSPIASRGEAGYWRFADSMATVFIPDEGPIPGLTITRPPDYPEFWQAIVDILRQTSSVLYWGRGAVIADRALIPHLPTSFVEKLGAPTVTSDIKEILDLIRDS
jgi:hypothetical protein